MPRVDKLLSITKGFPDSGFRHLLVNRKNHNPELVLLPTASPTTDSTSFAAALFKHCQSLLPLLFIYDSFRSLSWLRSTL